MAGWAHPASALRALGEALTPSYDVQAVSVHDWETPAGADYAAALAAALATAPEPPTIVGWSLGGLVALEMAARYPGRIAGLVAIGVTARFCAEDETGVPERRVRAMRAGLARDAHTTLADFIARSALPEARPPEEQAPRLRAALEIGTASLCRGLDYLRAFDLRSRLAAVTLPVLVVHGRADAIVPWQAGAALSRALPHGQWRLAEQSGHDLPLRRTAWLADLIRQGG